MKLPCSVTRDLLPLYAENMVERETGELIEQHLTDCPACREKLSGLKTETRDPIETAKPLQTLKKEIRKRRRYAAAIAALCVFVAVFTLFCHENEMRLVPWEEGLIEVKGIETRPVGDVYGKDVEPQGTAVDVLVLLTDSIINGTNETMFKDDDGTVTVILQGWTSHSRSRTREYNEMTLCPVPDRLIYETGGRQELLWGKPLSGGVETLPRLALGYYLILAVCLAAGSGAAWFFLRKRFSGRIVRQVFFAPLSYIAAHLLIKGFSSASFFMERDLFRILLTAAALYALFTLAWQVFLRRRKERFLSCPDTAHA